MNVHQARFLAFIATATLTALTAGAVPRSGEGTGRHYLVSAETLSSWHAGAYLRAHDRTVKRSGMEEDVEVGYAMAYVGRDLLSWLTVYGTLGVADLDEKRLGRSEDSAAYGLGVWFNLLDHDAFEFLESVQRFRVQGMLQYVMFRTDDVTWGEVSGNLTFGATHEVTSSKFFWPEAVTLYAGPTLNVIVSDEYDTSSDNMIGLVVGLDFQINRLTSLGASMEVFQDDNAAVGYVSVRF